MCDTIAALPGTTAGHVMLFGKNSDRQRNEAQAVEYFPARDHSSGTERRCTYICVPEIPRTHSILICRPFWIWGAEMGSNEFGVVIGNEGLRARCGEPREEALIGMDLLRLALERSGSAAQAVDVITTLLERYGQGGNCGHLQASHYHNSFMIADTEEAFVLETVAREWMVEPVRDVRALSNRYSIDVMPNRRSAGLIQLIAPGDDMSPAGALADDSLAHIGNANSRRRRAEALMRQRAGRLDAADMMSILRDHGEGDERQVAWRAECTTERTLCMHAGADDRPGQTVGSMVSELHKSAAVHWVTATAAPCLSIFKPVLLNVPLPSQGPQLTDVFDARTTWWRHERLHRAAMLGDPAAVLAAIRGEREELEAEFRSRMKAVMNGGTLHDQAHVVASCWKDASVAEDRWYARREPARMRQDAPYHQTWSRMNQLAGIEPSPERHLPQSQEIIEWE